MSAEDGDGDPFTCPMCGGSVRVSGGGVKDCTACPWDYRPETSKTTQQAGLGGF